MQSIVESARIKRRGNPYRDAEGKFCKQSEAVYIVDSEGRLKKYDKTTGPPKLNKGKGGNPYHAQDGKFASSTTKKSPVTKPSIPKPKQERPAPSFKDSGGLSGKQWKAIDPDSPSTAAEARDAMDSTETGRTLREMTKRWQTDIADCVSIQDEFMRAANGHRIAKGKQKEPKALMDAIEGSSVSPAIHRGNRFNAADIDKLKAGKTMILPPGSWTASPRIAGQFAKNPSRRKVIPVVFHVPGGAKALPIEKFGDPSHKNEREYISAGQFKVIKVSKRGGVTHVDLEHTAMFSWKGAQGEDAS